MNNNDSDMYKLLEDWVYYYVGQFIISDSYTPKYIIENDINMKVTDTGGTLLHLAMWHAPVPNIKDLEKIIKFLVNNCGADVNAPDDYGRTPLTLFMAHGTAAWSDHPYYAGSDPAFGVNTLKFFLDKGGNLDVLYTPDFISKAGCEKWRLIHECTYGIIKEYLTSPMLKILSSAWNPKLPDSSGRIANSDFAIDEDIFTENYLSEAFREGYKKGVLNS